MLTGGRAKGKKALVVMAVEVVTEPRGFGHCRMRVIPDASAAILHGFVRDNIEPGATAITDRWTGYQGLDKLGYRQIGVTKAPPRLAART